ncbi:hypothetical protein BGW36DRAFT_394665 [Talaromyces proteolyticus]|uniref:Uncharacterized protein n=1 Tax=Talaromyces proteolyticus TaxID=1131652 RepID=A0AAD4L0H9_9EURO|nr:uncharacterized protein BGW36DRAFT_394665 [Talaromyces proteolyticus]KAH8701876.1 hypothetical protein BGW36DRAFT_394665 [Talaromyces proteolyticus]
MAEVASTSSPIEARSLSSVTSIAANPPAYPRNPTQTPHDRLVLYIVKVPGSQDVVLTPLKPPTKSNISSEAINSSLYYLHVASESDEDVLRSLESEHEQTQHEPYGVSQHDEPTSSRLSSETFSRLNDFHRKPVGGGNGDGDREGIPPPPPPPHREIPSGQSVQRKLAPAADAYGHGEEGRKDENLKLFTIPRRPITSSDGPGAPPSTAMPSPQMRLDTERAQERGAEKVSSSPATGSPKSSSAFRITVIRRDPASGYQWNVGSISSSSTNKGTIRVEITNPGYGKFLNNEAFSLGQSLPAASHDGNAAAEAIKALALTTQQNNNHSDGIFRRDVVPIRHNQQHHHHNISKSEIFHRRSGSADSKITDIVNAKVTRGYYSFTSPWNGTCSFVASVNGRSIKCKHTIANPSRGAGADSHHNNNAEVTVSELRFNIPFPFEQTFRSPLASVVLGEKGSKRGALAQAITSNIQKAQQRARSRSGSESAPNYRPPSASSSEGLAAADEDRLDFSLAREPGGGGMSGKSAKLGKLVIEDEGIKMIDLVVATSMGVWWRACNRVP